MDSQAHIIKITVDYNIHPCGQIIVSYLRNTPMER